MDHSLILKPIDTNKYVKLTFKNKMEELGFQIPWYVLKKNYWINKWVNAEAVCKGKGGLLGSLVTMPGVSLSTIQWLGPE